MNFLAIPLFFSAIAAFSEIIQIESIHQIADSQPNHTIYFFDIDDTLFDSPHMLGSKAWRTYITKTTQADWHDIFSLFIARHHPLATIEPDTNLFVHTLQATGDVFGLTARERNRWYDTPVEDIDGLTVTQLHSVGIQFHRESLDMKYPDLIATPEYFKGIFFADTELKGEYLLKLFQTTTLPEKVVFIDDKYKQVASVAAALDQLGIDHECYWYVATDKKALDFDPLIANIQLYYFWTSEGKTVLSDQQAEQIAKMHPEKDVTFYLQDLLDNAF